MTFGNSQRALNPVLVKLICMLQSYCFLTAIVVKSQSRNWKHLSKNSAMAFLCLLFPSAS